MLSKVFFMHKGIAAKRMSGLSKVPAPTGFGFLSTPRDGSEAYVLTTLVPYVQNAHNPGDLQGGVPLVHVFFGSLLWGEPKK